ncbi:MAG: hypothetical protein ACTHO8_02945 [Solirubrobacterales bacterium]
MLPAGLSVEFVELLLRAPVAGGFEDFGAVGCEVDESGARAVVTCKVDESIPGAIEPADLIPGEVLQLIVHVTVPGSVSGPLLNEVAVEGGGALPKFASSTNEASPEPASAGVEEFRSEVLGEGGGLETQAGAHPFQYTTTFAVNTEPGPPGNAPFVAAGGDVKDIEVNLPPGLVGNPTSASRCTAQEFAQQRAISPSPGENIFRNECPAGSVVGFALVRQLEGISERLYEPIYELDPPLGMPAQFGFQILGAPFYIDTRVRAGSDYGISAFLANVAEVKRVTSASVTLWGTPGAAIHDPLRGDCLNESNRGVHGLSLGTCPSGIAPQAFFSNPTACEGPLRTTFAFDSWLHPGLFLGGEDQAPAPTGCGALDFSPSILVQPRTTLADSPTGLKVDLHVPQNDSPGGLAEADLRDAVVQLPAGMTVNPSSAEGLGSCSPAQVGLLSAVGETPARFSGSPGECPDAAKLGTVRVDTPLLDHPIEGAVYLAQQGQNPFGSLLALYITAFDPRSGVVLKLAGEVQADEGSGQLTARFDDNPQLPFEDLSLDFFQGPHAALRTPSTCGTYATTTDLRPWSAPQSGPDATPSDSFAVTTAPGGAACAPTQAQLPNAPGFQAGTEAPLAGRYSPFSLRVDRQDASQEFRGLTVTLPEGLTGKLAGVPYCPDAALSAAQAESGASESGASSCPAASRIGTVRVAVGAGSRPFQVSGQVYLAGPYKGAPISAAVVVPALAGPLDLGTVVVRAALRVDETTAQITAVSDPLPTILRGIPLDVREIALRLDRPDFTLNPTDCEPMAVRGIVSTVTGQVAAVASRFQVGGCGGLRFAPRLSLGLKGGTRHGAHPALRAVVRASQHEADIARTAVVFPPTVFIDQGHIREVCTRVQFAAHACPASSVLGRARAVTPLLDRPLEGPVYFRSNGSERTLPDVVADLNGQIHIVLIGFVGSKHAKGSEVSRLKTTFATVPDAPISKFSLDLKGGKHGLLVNSADLCSHRQRAEVSMRGQNGKTTHTKLPIATSCGKGRR